MLAPFVMVCSQSCERMSSLSELRKSLLRGNERFERRELEGVLALVSLAGEARVWHEPDEDQAVPGVRGVVRRVSAAVAESQEGTS